MKKKYDTKVTELLSSDIVVFSLFILAVISGSLYALYTKNKDHTAFIILNNYLQLDTKAAFEIKKVVSSFWTYFKQLILLWLFGFFSFTIPFSMAVLFEIVFAYAFTTTCILLVYGIKGIAIAFCTYGLQAIIMLMISLYLAIMSLRKKTTKAASVLGQYQFCIVPVLACSCIMSFLDVAVVENIHLIIDKFI